MYTVHYTFKWGYSSQLLWGMVIHCMEIGEVPAHYFHKLLVMNQGTYHPQM